MVSLTSLGLAGHGLTRLDSRHWPVELLPDLQALRRRRTRRAPPS